MYPLKLDYDPGNIITFQIRHKLMVMKRNFVSLFVIQVFCWLLNSCHKETPNLVIPPVQPPILSPPVKEIINNNLQWTASYSTKSFLTKLTELKPPPSPYSADSIQAVYIFQDILNNGYYQEIKRGKKGTPYFYYEIENNSLILHKKMMNYNANVLLDGSNIFLKIAKVVFR